ncbi:MAG: AhpC/TSA family protein [Tannerella sp.]|nr:AhpC/TSA family protein [Tannerella sp.]
MIKNFRKIKNLIAVYLLLSAVYGCNDSQQFTVKGTVAGAVDQILYLEHSGLPSVTVLDSLKLKPNGKFEFRQPRPEYPDFYRLRLKNNIIHFAVDSTETITITADAHTFSTSYTVEGSENSKAFKDITLAQLDANQELTKLRESFGMNLIPDTTYQASVLKAVNTYKDAVKKYVFGAPASPAAYFALFQQIDGLWFYDLYDRNDSKAYGAVATNYKTYYPNSPRSKHLEQLALQSLKIVRGERMKNVLDYPEAKEVKFIDIDLPGIAGKNVKLSDIAKGKAVLVNFTAFQTEWSANFNMTLNNLYTKYHNNGFDIYQVSLDNDAHFWRNAASNIPWVSVRDPQSIYSSIAAIYNVRQLPALFLINKKGEMYKRIDSVDTIEDDIKAAL